MTQCCMCGKTEGAAPVIVNSPIIQGLGICSGCVVTAVNTLSEHIQSLTGCLHGYGNLIKSLPGAPHEAIERIVSSDVHETPKEPHDELELKVWKQALQLREDD